MAARPKWWHILQESRRQACTAIDFYNRSGNKRSYLDFVVHMHLAWQYLLQAECAKQKQDYVYRNSRGHALKTKDGDRKTWDLQRCLEWRYTADANPVRLNVEFFIGLRNKIEHRFQDSLMLATAGQAHAYVINFEAEMVAAFGAEHSLSDELRFPVFVQSLSPQGLKEQLALRKRLPAGVNSYITGFESKLDQQVRGSERYEYRVLLIQAKGPKTEADAAITFIKAEDLTAERRAQMEREGKIGTAVVVEKERSVLHSNELAPAQVVELVDTASAFEFNMWHHSQLVAHFKIKPAKGGPADDTDRKYCLYDKPWQKYVYTQAWVKKCSAVMASREKYKEVFGKEPRTKVSNLTTRAEANAAAVARPSESA